MQERALRFGAPELLVLVELGDVVVPGVMEGPMDARAIGDEVELVGERVEDLGLSVCRFRPAGPAAA